MAFGTLEQAINLIREQRRSYPVRSDYHRVCTVLINKLTDALQREIETESAHWTKEEALSQKFLRITR